MSEVDVIDRDGRSELHDAAFLDDVARVGRLVAAGANVDLQDRTGLAPLHLAAQEFAVAAAGALLDAGASVDAVNEHGNTPLFVAVFNSNGRGEMIGLLCERGADPDLTNAHGQSPRGLAELIGNYDVKPYFGGPLPVLALPDLCDNCPRAPCAQARRRVDRSSRCETSSSSSACGHGRSTRVLDGDLSPLAELPRLRELRMMNRRGYRPQVPELQAVIAERTG